MKSFLRNSAYILNVNNAHHSSLAKEVMQVTALNTPQAVASSNTGVILQISAIAAALLTKSIHAQVEVHENLATGQTIISGQPAEIARVMAEINNHATPNAPKVQPQAAGHITTLVDSPHESPAHHTQTDAHPASYGAGISWFAQAFTTSDSQTTSSVAELYTANYNFHGSDDTFLFVNEALPSEPVVEHATSTDAILVAFKPEPPQSLPPVTPIAPALPLVPETLPGIAVVNPSPIIEMIAATLPPISNPAIQQGGSGTSAPAITTLTGTSGADTITSGAGVHVIQGLAGNDVLYAHSAFTSVGTQGAFTPKNVAGLQLWLDGADSTTLFADNAGTVTITNGAGVALWRDKSGNGNDAVQTSAGSRPVWSSNGQNGHGVLQFDGVDDGFSVNLNFLAGSSHTSFIDALTTNYSNFYGATNPNSGANSPHIGFLNSTGYRINYWGNDFYPNITSAFNYGASNMLTFEWANNLSKTVYANGNLEGTLNQPGIISTLSGGGNIANNVVGQGYWGGNLNEMIFYTVVLSTADRQLLELYQSNKWGIALATTNTVADAPGIFQDDYYSVDKAAATNTLVADLREVLGSVTQTYSITSGNSGNIFAIDATTGQIKVNDATALAASNATSFSLGISASLSSGGAPITLTTQIAVADSSADTLEGGAGNDSLHGSAGNNLLDGGADNDVLYGLSGNDTLIGGIGQDTMTGGIGTDRFTFTILADSPNATPDTITDFDANGDLIVLTGMLTGAFTFVGAHTTSFTGAGNASARFNDASDLLQLDANGDGAVDFTLILKGVALADISITDFVL